MMAVIECTQGHYEVQETPYGEAYVWRHEHVVVECDCGRKPVLSTSETLCSCGADHAALVREELASGWLSERAAHPWDDEYSQWRKKRDEFLRSEYHDWLEWRVIE